MDLFQQRHQLLEVGVKLGRYLHAVVAFEFRRLEVRRCRLSAARRSCIQRRPGIRAHNAIRRDAAGFLQGLYGRLCFAAEDAVRRARLKAPGV